MRPSRFLYPVEQLLLCLVLGLMAVCLWLASGRNVGFAVAGYAKPMAISALLMCGGLAYRVSARNLRIASALIATGLFVALTLWLATLNYLFMPIERPLIDPFLAALDASLGIRWSAVVAYADNYPAPGAVLAFCYMATLSQVAALIAILGLTGRADKLHEMCLTIALAALGAVLFWRLFPSIGPAWLSLETDGLAGLRTQPLLGSAWGAQAYRTVTQGVSVLDPDMFEGMIAFPSLHTVLALVLLWFSREIRWCFPLALVLNLPVFPAVMVHGGHHFVDIPAGFLTFGLALWAARTTSAALASRARYPFAQPAAAAER